jgi:hypothetical protein
MSEGVHPEPVEEIRPDATDRLVTEYDRIFQGIPVEGIDLASANRLSFYLAVQNEQAFAAPALRQRVRSALMAEAVFLRSRLRGTSAAPPLPRPGTPKLLFFFEGINPSVDGTLRSVLRQFAEEEVRAVIAYSAKLELEGEHECMALPSFLPERVADSLAGLDRALRDRQRQAVGPVLRRRSLGAWLRVMALRTARAGRAFRGLYEAFPTRLLVTASDTSFWGRCATLEAIRRGIPSFTLQHGMMVGEAGYVPVISTRFAAWGEGSARWLRARGVPAEKIVVTGAPRLDIIVNGARAPREAVARALGVDPSRRWVTLATNPIVFARNAALLTTARQGVRAWDERALLLVKPHPSEDIALYRAAIGDDPRVLPVPHGSADLYDLLARSDAVLTFHSSVGLEAMLLDRAVVSLEAFGEENPLPYARVGAAAAARTPEELARALREDVPPGTNAEARRAARQRFVRDNLFAADGKSAERVADLVRTHADEVSR